MLNRIDTSISGWAPALGVCDCDYMKKLGLNNLFCLHRHYKLQFISFLIVNFRIQIHYSSIDGIMNDEEFKMLYQLYSVDDDHLLRVAVRIRFKVLPNVKMAQISMVII